jgi:uncharacterized protein involved in exopolysaccharide biosynthesis
MTQASMESQRKPRSAVSAVPDGTVFEFSLLRLASAILRYRFLVLTLAFVMAAVLVAITLASPRTYTVDTSFIPQSQRGQSQLASLGAQFGIPIGGSDPSQSPDFYVDLVRSREILRQVAEAKYSFGVGDGKFSGSYVDFISPGKEPYRLRLEKAATLLASSVASAASPKTGVISITVTTTSPALSRQLADQVLQQISNFNKEVRQSQASEEKKFTEARLAEGADELRTAENRLQTFSQQNREFGGSPALGVERDRLNREVSMRQQIYTTLAQAYEQAKIDEVRESSVITIVNPPVDPARPDPRGLATRGLAGLLLGGMLGVFIALLKAYFARTRENDPDDFGEFAELSRQALDDFKRPWKPAARLFGRQPS